MMAQVFQNQSAMLCLISDTHPRMEELDSA